VLAVGRMTVERKAPQGSRRESMTDGHLSSIVSKVASPHRGPPLAWLSEVSRTGTGMTAAEVGDRLRDMSREYGWSHGESVTKAGG
jgi:hypothetical protein